MPATHHDTPAVSAALIGLGAPSPRRSQKIVANAHADFLDLPGLESDPEIDERKCLIYVQARQVSVPTYPDCPCTNKGVILHTPFTMKGILDVPRGRKSVVIDIERRRWICKNPTCRRTVTQPLDFMAEGHYKMTRRLLEYVQFWSLQVTELSLAEETGVFVRTIREIREEYVGRLQKEITFEAPRVLGLDGVRADHRKRRVILTDIAEGLVRDLLESGKSKNIAAAIRLLPGWKKIRIFTIDMCKTLRAAVREVQPDAVIIIDLYHVVKMANEVMDTVRSRLYKKDKDKREPGQRRPRPEPFRKRRAGLTDDDREYMELWFEERPELRLAYNLKEDFMAIFDKETYGGELLMGKAAARRAYEKWEKKLPAEGGKEYEALLKDFKKIRTAVKNWGEYIFNYFDHYPYVSNAFTESMNRKVKDILRDARGCKFETLRARIVYGTYLRKQLRSDRWSERQALLPHSRSRRQQQRPKGKGEGAARPPRDESQGHRQMILDFSASEVDEPKPEENGPGTFDQQWDLVG